MIINSTKDTRSPEEVLKTHDNVQFNCHKVFDSHPCEPPLLLSMRACACCRLYGRPAHCATLPSVIAQQSTMIYTTNIQTQHTTSNHNKQESKRSRAFEPQSLDSESRVLTVTPRDQVMFEL